MEQFTCAKCGHKQANKTEIIAQAQLLGFSRVAVGGPMNHRIELVHCAKCGFISESYYRGRVF